MMNLNVFLPSLKVSADVAYNADNRTFAACSQSRGQLDGGGGGALPEPGSRTDRHNSPQTAVSGSDKRPLSCYMAELFTES